LQKYSLQFVYDFAVKQALFYLQEYVDIAEKWAISPASLAIGMK